MEGVGAAAGDDADFAGRRASMFGEEIGALHLEFGDRIDTGVGQQQQIRATLHIVGSIDEEAILGRTATIDGKVDLVRKAGRVGSADIELVGGHVGGDPRL